MTRRLEEEPQNGPYYFTQEDLLRRYPDILPKGCNWQEMMERREIFDPGVLLTALSRAEEFLMTEPGPNSLDRRILAPAWFRYWEELVEGKINQRKKTRLGFVQSLHLVPFDEVKSNLEGKKKSGVLFVAGAEGHYGHVHAANFMRMFVFSVWAFERDSYFKKKARQAPFLPLPIRLSMWDYFGINILTVLPEKDTKTSESSHYKKLFDQLGATYCFATKDDPNLYEKIRRGLKASFSVIPKVRVEKPTTDRVQRAWPVIEFPTFETGVIDDLIFIS